MSYDMNIKSGDVINYNLSGGSLKGSTGKMYIAAIVNDEYIGVDAKGKKHSFKISNCNAVPTGEHFDTQDEYEKSLYFGKEDKKQMSEIIWIEKTTRRGSSASNSDITITTSRKGAARKGYAITFRNGSAEKIDPDNVGYVCFGIGGNKLYFMPKSEGGYCLSKSGADNRRIQVDAVRIDEKLKDHIMPVGGYSLHFDNFERLYYIEF